MKERDLYKKITLEFKLKTVGNFKTTANFFNFLSFKKKKKTRKKEKLQVNKYLFSDKRNIHKIKTDKLQCYDKNWQTRFH